MIFTFVYADFAFEWNSSNWRSIIPANAINRQGKHKVHLFHLEDFNKDIAQLHEACSQSDIIVVERNLFGETLSKIQYWKARDKVVVTNFDDAYQLMHPGVGSYNFWHKGMVKGKGADGKAAG